MKEKDKIKGYVNKDEEHAGDMTKVLVEVWGFEGIDVWGFERKVWRKLVCLDWVC